MNKFTKFTFLNKFESLKRNMIQDPKKKNIKAVMLLNMISGVPGLPFETVHLLPFFFFWCE